jgi:hypothetical protein
MPVSIVTMGWMARVPFPLWLNFIFLRVHIGSVANPASYPVGTGSDFLGINRPGREANHSSPPSAVVKNGGAIPPLPLTILWHKHRDNFNSPCLVVNISTQGQYEINRGLLILVEMQYLQMLNWPA